MKTLNLISNIPYLPVHINMLPDSAIIKNSYDILTWNSRTNCCYPQETTSFTYGQADGQAGKLNPVCPPPNWFGWGLMILIVNHSPNIDMGWICCLSFIESKYTEMRYMIATHMLSDICYLIWYLTRYLSAGDKWHWLSYLLIFPRILPYYHTNLDELELYHNGWISALRAANIPSLIYRFCMV